MDLRVLQRVESVLRRAFTREIEFRVDENDSTTAVVIVNARGGPCEHRLVATWAGEGWPADVTSAAQVAPHAQVVIARDLSVGARDRLEQMGLGWADETGRARIVRPSGLIVLRDATRYLRKQQPGGRWSPAMIAVAEAILSGTTAQVRPIEEATEYSRGAVARALTRLADVGLLTSEKARGPMSGRRMADASLLLDEYARAVESTATDLPRIRMHRLWSDPLDALIDDIAPALDQAGEPWAATGAGASLLLAPYLSGTTTLDLYVSADLFNDPERLGEVLGASVVESGHRIEVQPLFSPVTARAGRTIDGVRCATAARVYADLRAKGGRAAEAADHLREVLHVGAGT